MTQHIARLVRSLSKHSFSLKKEVYYENQARPILVSRERAVIIGL